MPRRFATSDEEVLVSLPHAVKLANMAYALLKDSNLEGATKTVGLLLSYLRGDKDDQT